MVEQDRTTKITETKLNGIIFVVQSSFNANCKDTAVEKMAKVLQNELREERSPSQKFNTLKHEIAFQGSLSDV